MILIYQITLKDDITLINVDAIVNPANKNGLGCFQKNHKCLDNIIHRNARPRLRDECRKILKGHLLDTPTCMITGGYKLPCKNIIHVAGPNFYEDGILNFPLLIKCYDNAIEMAIRLLIII